MPWIQMEDFLKKYWVPTGCFGLALAVLDRWFSVSGFVASAWLNWLLFSAACLFASAGAWAMIATRGAPWPIGMLGAIVVTALMLLIFRSGLRTSRSTTASAEQAEAPPVAPRVEIQTMPGLLPPEGGGIVAIEDGVRFRDHTLTITNSSSQVLYQVTLLIQLPELTQFPVRMTSTHGIDVVVSPSIDQWQIQGAGSTTQPKETRALAFVIDIKELPPGPTVELVVRTESPSWEETQMNFMFSRIGSPDVLRYYVKGRYQYGGHDKRTDRMFLVPLAFENGPRTVLSQSSEPYPGSRRLFYTGYNPTAVEVGPGMATGTKPIGPR